MYVGVSIKKWGANYTKWKKKRVKEVNPPFFIFTWVDCCKTG